MQQGNELGLALGLRLVKRVENQLQVRGVTARRDLGVFVRVDVYQPGGVALIDDEVAERRGQALGVV